MKKSTQDCGAEVERTRQLQETHSINFYKHHQISGKGQRWLNLRKYFQFDPIFKKMHCQSAFQTSIKSWRTLFLEELRGVVCRPWGGDFGRSVNPISTGGADYALQIILAPLDFDTFLRPCRMDISSEIYLPLVLTFRGFFEQKKERKLTVEQLYGQFRFPLLTMRQEWKFNLKFIKCERD